jgi:acetoacetyl-CoA synthetase
MTRVEPRITGYQRLLQQDLGLAFDSYEAMWAWSVSDLRAFWGSLWRYFQIESPTPWRTELEAAVMPGACWFPGAQVNWTRQLLRHGAAAHAAGHPAIVFQNERMAAPVDIGWPELQRQVAVFATRLRAAGVQRGDRVCGWLPNTPHAIVAFLATASLGAVWSLCSPDMGPVAVLDRFRQIAPRVLMAVDGQFYGGRAFDRRAGAVRAAGRAAQRAAPGAAGRPGPDAGRSRLRQRSTPAHRFECWTAGDAPAGSQPDWLPFDHPLWVVYSSGTTGLPKPIVHGHGGVMLEMLKMAVLHNDVGPSVATGDRYHWYSSTGWIMWNARSVRCWAAPPSASTTATRA